MQRSDLEQHQEKDTAAAPKRDHRLRAGTFRANDRVNGSRRDVQPGAEQCKPSPDAEGA